MPRARPDDAARAAREVKKARRAAGALAGSSPHALSAADEALLAAFEARAAPLWAREPIAAEAGGAGGDGAGGDGADAARAAADRAAADRALELGLQAGEGAGAEAGCADGSPGGAAASAAAAAALAARLAARRAFVDAKKAPQIRWVLARVRELLARLPPQPLVVDFGGGRGGLALALARALPLARVVCVDASPAAVATGARAAAAAGAGNLSFVCAALPLADARTVLGGEAPAVAVGLHACGGLTDAVLKHVREAGARAFVLVPCCATKNAALAEGVESAGGGGGGGGGGCGGGAPAAASDYAAAAATDARAWDAKRRGAEAAAARRLAESPERAISERAYTAINSARLNAVAAGGGGWALRLVEMPAALSARNQALIGLRGETESM